MYLGGVVQKRRKAKRRREVPGTFLRIPLADGSFGYGRILEQPYTAFYNHHTTEPISDLDVIASKPVLFSQAVEPDYLRVWTQIGRRDLEGEVARRVVRFWQDDVGYRSCVIFDSVGMEKKVRPEACVGLEHAAAWTHHHIEERLLDTFMGRPNISELSLRVRLSDRYREYRTAEDLPGWTFEVEEIADGTYRVRGFDHDGRTVEGTGAHAGIAFEEGKRLAAKLTRRRGGGSRKGRRPARR